MANATGDSVLRAFNKVARNIQRDDTMTSSATSAGFILPVGQKRGQKEGWQVFVKMVAYSDAKLKSDPMSGGLATDP